VLAPLAAALQGGLHTVFWMIAGLSIAAFATSLLFPVMRVESEAQGQAG